MIPRPPGSLNGPDPIHPRTIRFCKRAAAAYELALAPMNEPAKPRDLARVRYVDDFEQLVGTPFSGTVNALCWRRKPEGDFSEVAAALAAAPGITPLSPQELRSLRLGAAGQRAVEWMLADLDLLEQAGLQPSLDSVNGYTHPLLEEPLRTDVCSFHADSATAEADTFLCTYHGASSWGLLNEEAACKVDLPEVRACLLAAYGGPDDGEFQTWLEDHFHDLHYRMLPGARPYSFEAGNLWRVATSWPGSPVPPCIHRAPDPVPGETRLLLIS
jgi:hypothetical protein